MNKKIYLAMALTTIAMSGCSVDEGLDIKEDVKHEHVFNTTSFTGTREDIVSGQQGANTRTIVDLKTWEVGWNDGSTVLDSYFAFNVNEDEPSTTASNYSVDYVEFLKTGGSNWEFLANRQDRQVFKLQNLTAHAHDGDNDIHQGCCADFATADDIDILGNVTYDGLDPNTTYHAYCYPDFILKSRMPLSTANCPQPYIDGVQKGGYTTNPVPLAATELKVKSTKRGTKYTAYFDKSVQAFLMQNDILEGYVHGTDNRQICPSKVGTYNEQTNSYDLQLDFRHKFALVEIDVCFVKEPEATYAKGMLLNVAKLVALYDGSGTHSENGRAIFKNIAYLDGQADWGYSLSGVVENKRSDSFCCYNEAVKYQNNGDLMSKAIDGKPTIRFFLLVDQHDPCDYYAVQVFNSNTSHREVFFYPGHNFMFEPGKYYRIQLDVDAGNTSNSSEWESTSDDLTHWMKGVYPSGNNKDGNPYWGNKQ